mmetsp:Transcript_72789/g.109802  ORF Transcript_72789/g.109802 Transcript_72789/m.109802 type:complete len:91 (+) Transcript_72789:801-1073(+)
MALVVVEGEKDGRKLGLTDADTLIGEFVGNDCDEGVGGDDGGVIATLPSPAAAFSSVDDFEESPPNVTPRMVPSTAPTIRINARTNRAGR